MRLTGVLFLVQLNNFALAMGFLLELHTLTQVARSYALLLVLIGIKNEHWLSKRTSGSDHDMTPAYPAFIDATVIPDKTLVIISTSVATPVFLQWNSERKSMTIVYVYD